MRARKMIRVVIESPYAGNIYQRWRNRRYARKAMLNSLGRSEAPIASHLLYTQVLDDGDRTDRAMGINAGLEWLSVADAVVVYIDYGISSGMKSAIKLAIELNKPVHYRSLYLSDTTKAIHESSWSG